MVFMRLAITPPKVSEVWSTVSTLLGSGRGRFWARSAQ